MCRWQGAKQGSGKIQLPEDQIAELEDEVDFLSLKLKEEVALTRTHARTLSFLSLPYTHTHTHTHTLKTRNTQEQARRKAEREAHSLRKELDQCRVSNVDKPKDCAQVCLFHNLDFSSWT